MRVKITGAPTLGARGLGVEGPEEKNKKKKTSRPGLLSLLLAGAADKSPDPEAAALHRVAGDTALRAGDVARAIREFSSAVTADKSDWHNFYRRATAYLVEGRLKAALRDLDVVLRMNPENSHAAGRRAKIRLRRCDFEGALADARVAGDKAAGKTAQDGARALKAGNWDAVIDTSPDCVEALVARSQARLKAGDVSGAAYDAKRALAVDADSLAGMIARTEAAGAEGDIAGALASAKACLRSDMENKVCKEQRKRFKAWKKALEAFEKMPSRGEAKAAAAEAALEVIGRGHPVLAPPLEKAICEFGGDVGACASWAREVDSVDAMKTWAKAAEKAKDWDQAVRAWNSARSKAPADQDIIRNLQNAEIQQKRANRKDYYKILGVSKGASAKDIKQQYRRLAKEKHPDKCAGQDESKREDCASAFRDITDAYETLLDPEKKRAYDNGDDLRPQQHHATRGGGGFPFQFTQGGPGGGVNFNFQQGGF